MHEHYLRQIEDWYCGYSGTGVTSWFKYIIDIRRTRVIEKLK